jgi:hypothetical protein
MKIKDFHALVEGRLSPSTELGQDYYLISPSVAVVSIREVSSTKSEIIPEGQVVRVNGFQIRIGEVCLDGYMGWFTLEDFKPAPCVATIVKSQTMMKLKVVLPLNARYRFCEQFGDRFAVNYPEIGRRLPRSVASCAAEPLIGSANVYVELLPDELPAFREFVESFE